MDLVQQEDMPRALRQAADHRVEALHVLPRLQNILGRGNRRRELFGKDGIAEIAAHALRTQVIDDRIAERAVHIGAGILRPARRALVKAQEDILDEIGGGGVAAELAVDAAQQAWPCLGIKRFKPIALNIRHGVPPHPV